MRKKGEREPRVGPDGVEGDRGPDRESSRDRGSRVGPDGVPHGDGVDRGEGLSRHDGGWITWDVHERDCWP